MTITTVPKLDSYTLIEELGRDEVVTEYRGLRQVDQAAVLIQMVAPLFATDEFLVRRFKHVTEQLARLEHPNIVRIYEAEKNGDDLYLVQDWVEARPLSQVLAEEGSFSPQRMQHVARQLASALDYAHQKLVTHGNLSAKNVLLGPNDQVFVVNFGQTQALFGVNLMKHGYNVNTPETMAPERVHGQGPSRHADLYALGVLCYQMLAGKPPFSGSPAAILHAQAYKQPKMLYQLNPGISVAVSEVVGRMMSKGLELRYNTGAEFARALSVACNLPKGFPTHGLRPDTPSLISFSRLGHLVGGVLVLLLVAISLVLTGYWLGTNRQPVAATEAARVNLPAATRPVTSEAQLLPPAGSPTAPQPAPPTDVLRRTSLSDTFLLPTRTPTAVSNTVLIGPTPALRLVTTVLTPTPAQMLAPPVKVPQGQPAAVGSKPEPVIPAGKGVFTFFNPTGYDLVVDLTGPTGESELIPPYDRQQFVLSPGRYQLMIHTPTGGGLTSRTLEFNLPEGLVVEKDYYTDYNTALH